MHIIDGDGGGNATVVQTRDDTCILSPTTPSIISKAVPLDSSPAAGGSIAALHDKLLLAWAVHRSANGTEVLENCDWGYVLPDGRSDTSTHLLDATLLDPEKPISQALEDITRSSSSDPPQGSSIFFVRAKDVSR